MVTIRLKAHITDDGRLDIQLPEGLPAGEVDVTIELPDAFDTDEDIDPVEAFREGWRDAMTGRTYPASTLWEDIDDEPTGSR
ncbi:MAG: hypothetical protein K8I30_10945 [Anaerolineae bacterium]|nr:hypothetical protein [Anaerolineae bacterium]